MTYYELVKKVKNAEDTVNEINNLNDEYFENVINHFEKLKKDRGKKKNLKSLYFSDLALIFLFLMESKYLNLNLVEKLL